MDQFSQIVASGNFVILDTETTGLHNAEICQIAIIDANGNPILDTLVKPTRGIPNDAWRIHGISNAKVAEAPSWLEVGPRVQAALRGRNVFIYNADYDVSVLHSASYSVGIDFEESWRAVHCVMTAFASFYGDWNEYRQSYTWKKLDFAARHLGVPVSGAHSALGDCKMTLGVLLEMERRIQEGRE